MTNRQMAAILFNIATLLDMAQDNVYRVRAYHRAARRLLALREEATAIAARGDELPLPGVGPRIRRKLAELIDAGAMAFYDELLEDVPPAVRSLMAVDGVGPKTALRLSHDLGIATPRELIAAAGKGQIHDLHGFGDRREALLARAARDAASLGDGRRAMGGGRYDGPVDSWQSSRPSQLAVPSPSEAA